MDSLGGGRVAPLITAMAAGQEPLQAVIAGAFTTHGRPRGSGGGTGDTSTTTISTTFILGPDRPLMGRGDNVARWGIDMERDGWALAHQRHGAVVLGMAATSAGWLQP